MTSRWNLNEFITLQEQRFVTLHYSMCSHHGLTAKLWGSDDMYCVCVCGTSSAKRPLERDGDMKLPSSCRSSWAGTRTTASTADSGTSSNRCTVACHRQAVLERCRNLRVPEQTIVSLHGIVERGQTGNARGCGKRERKDFIKSQSWYCPSSTVQCTWRDHVKIRCRFRMKYVFHLKDNQTVQ